jgi:hypothetical protein
MLLAAALLTAAFVIPVEANVELTDVGWETVGTDVHFHLQFHNPDLVNPSGEVSGVLSSQPFGAFVPNNGEITTFNVPQLAPDSFFDVDYVVSLADLPPSAEQITPGGGGGGGTAAQTQGCPPNLFWAGNVDVFWSGPGGSGQVNYHLGQMQVCPGGGPSYIHVLMDCQDPAGISWSFSGLCAGWTASLVVDDGAGNPNGAAPNPIPPGFFDGWICLSADASVAVGAQCCFALNLNCGTQPATINVCADACIWEPVSTEESTWGRVKALYKEDE